MTPIPGFTGDCRIEEAARDRELCVIAVWIGGKPLTASLTQNETSGVTTQLLQVGHWTGTVSSRGKLGDHFSRIVRVSLGDLPRYDGIAYEVVHCAPECTKSTVVVLGSTGARVDVIFRQDIEGVAVIDRATKGITIDGQTYSVGEEAPQEAAANTPTPPSTEAPRPATPPTLAPTVAPSVVPTPRFPVYLYSEQLIMPAAELPLPGYAVTVNQADGSLGWRRDFEKKLADFAVITLRLYVYPPAHRASDHIASTTCDWQFADQSRVASEPKVATSADGSRACIYTFGRGESWAVYTTGTRNVVATVGVAPGLASVDATMAMDQAIALARQQIAIVDRVSPPTASPQPGPRGPVGTATPRP